MIIELMLENRGDYAYYVASIATLLSIFLEVGSIIFASAISPATKVLLVAQQTLVSVKNSNRLNSNAQSLVRV